MTEGAPGGTAMVSSFLVAIATEGGFWTEFWQKLRNPIVAVGLAGQAIFAGRMVVQWWVSEKHGRSLVPKLFWHMSLWGSVLVLIYGFCDRDPVVIVGQLLGFVIYVRNLVLLSRRGDGASPSTVRFDSSTSPQTVSRKRVAEPDPTPVDPLDRPVGRR
jgi:lipid-A-disaccharide synthase-like uncharacterized protein